MKVGHLARFVHDGQLVLITFVPRIGVIEGIFIGGERNGKVLSESR